MSSDANRPAQPFVVFVDGEEDAAFETKVDAMAHKRELVRHFGFESSDVVLFVFMTLTELDVYHGLQGTMFDLECARAAKKQCKNKKGLKQ